MSSSKFVEVHVGDEVRLRRPHPCGSVTWTVIRIGADIGLRCATCQHRVMLTRSVFERRLKEFVTHAPLGQSVSVALSDPPRPVSPD